MRSGNRNREACGSGASRSRRAAFSFVEILFAVMILGVGFIMLAGIFPVAISQTQTTGEEANAANIGRSAAAYLEKLPETKRPWVFPADNVVHRFDTTQIQPPLNVGGSNESLWQRVRGNLVVPEDPRYAWVPLVRRWKKPPRPTVPPTPITEDSLAHDFAEVTIFVLRVRNRTEYIPKAVNGDLFVSPSNQGTFVPQGVTVHLREGYGGGDTIRIESNTPHGVTPGAFVVIAAGNDASDRAAAGRTYRVGNPVAEGNRNEYFLAPGNDMAVLPGNDGQMQTNDDIKEDTPSGGLPAWVIGEGLDPTGNFSGGAQDVGVYTTYIKLNS
jgi:hypothetical protein